MIMIIYDKAFKLLEEKGYTTYRIRKENILGQSQLSAMKGKKGNGIPKGVSDQTINRLCALLDCQPGDLMEYVPDKPTD